MATYDYKKIDKKWQKNWIKSGVFEPEVDRSRKKFFITVPIPYPSGSMHLGHMYTWTRADIYARFMRMRGYNVLFPQGFHFTGGPIVGMAEKVKQKDPKTLEAFRIQGVSESDLKKFADDPRALAEYFADGFRKDWENIGMSIDWRRTFITTDLSPYFSKFVSWQFNKLKTLGLITEGKHPVVWCPKENTPLGDHDRSEGEGESPEKFSIVKFSSGKFIFPAATLRPETVYGATNMWINGEGEYCILNVDSEKWVVSKDSVPKLKSQLQNVSFEGDVKIKDFIGKSAKNPLNGRELPIFSESFIDTAIGTGIAMSVPMHAPMDFYGLRKMRDEWEKLKPERIIDVTGEENIVEDAIKRFGDSIDGLKEATKYVYKKEFNAGIMRNNSAELSGLAVKEARDTVRDSLEEHRAYSEMYELTGRVVCRDGTPGIVKVLEKQWFIRYSDAEWKTKTRRLIERMNIFPEDARLQLLNTLEWLEDKAAARKGGLGTPLPWDKDWIIEPLSDSTIYMAYYTIANKISKIAIEKLTDNVFDYIFLGRKIDGKPDKEIEETKKEFEYWYPLDMRVSAKELLQNHFIFFLLNHTAIFNEENWPRGIQINGWLTVSGEKLSKSKGATLTIKRGLETYGTDQLRILAAAGNGMDDVEWNPASISAFDQRFGLISDLIKNFDSFTGEKRLIDSYILSKMNRVIKETTENLRCFRYGNALSLMLFALTNEIKLYTDMGGNNKETVKTILFTFLKLNHPVFPHITEELNHVLGSTDMLETSVWPVPEESLSNEGAENEVEVLKATIEDIKNIIKIVKKSPEKIIIGVADSGKFEIYNSVVKAASSTKNIIEIRKTLRTNSKILDKLLKNPNKLPEKLLDERLEYGVFMEAKDYLNKTFNCGISIEKESKEEKALPGKPSIKII
ncbi:MAG: leucine--tRNA ligase [Candidatus Parvarchaeota archaeon]|nr:leucine--tRNA ligase [Candidatus Parvarchaeota archaeon]